MQCTSFTSDQSHNEILPHLEELISQAEGLNARRQSDSSAQYYLQAYELADSIGSELEIAIAAGCLGNHYLRQTGNINSAQTYLTIERDILERHNEPITLIRNYLNLAFLRVKKLDLPYAQSYAMMALDLAARHQLKDSALWVDIHCGIGNVHYNMLHYDQAINDYRHALQYVTKTQEGASGWNRIALGFAHIYNNRRDTISFDRDTALYWLEEFYNRNFNDTAALADYEYATGIHYYLNADYTRSISHLMRATEYYRSNPGAFAQPDAFVVLSAAYQFDSLYAPALQAVDSALILIFGFDYDLHTLKKDIRSIVPYASRAEILADSGMSHNMMEPVYEAIRIYQDLDSLIAYFMKHETESYIHHQFYNNFYYYKRIQINAFAYSYTLEPKWLYDIHDEIAAYKAQSFMRDKILNDLFNSEARRYGSVQKYVENDIALENAYFKIRNIADAYNPSMFSAINSLLRDREKIIIEMQEETPQTLKAWTEINNISAQELLQYTIDHKTPVINYYIGNPFYNKEHIYILKAYNGYFYLDVLPNAPRILSLVDSLYRIHENFTEFKTEDIQWYYTASHFLYEILVDTVIRVMTEGNDMVIIPDHYLHRLAFDALVTNQYTGTETAFVPAYFVEQKNITYTFSPNSLLFESQPNEDEHTLDILAMGFSDRKTFARSADEIPELPSSITELQIINEYEGAQRTRIFSGYECTKQNFLKYAGKAACIHLSTHGTFDARNRHSSMLYMRSRNGIDGLYQHELRYADISPDLLVLSACDSGAGMLSNEEGMFSVGRAFQAAGTQYVISALWPLSDRASKMLFANFYEHYLSGSTPASALRASKLTAIRRNDQLSFPAYWGALMLHQ